MAAVMNRPAQRHLEPITEQDDDREAIAKAIGKILRIARHVAKLNLVRGPYDAVESNLINLRAAVDSALECTNDAP
jgi:hypothetical protein